MKFHILKKQLLLAVLALMLLATAGCGVKMWLAPQQSEDLYTFASVEGRRVGECLKVVVKVDGAYKNVDNLSLQFQADGSGPGEGCPTCPFFPAIRKDFTPVPKVFNLTALLSYSANVDLIPLKAIVGELLDAMSTTHLE